MNDATRILLLAILLGVSGCSPELSQRNYHAGLETRCEQQGLVRDTQEFKECFAKALARDMAPEPGAKPYKPRKSWQHYMQ